jgi:amino acid adenylation domain-containing protein/non-ribosomal peptide synthase protein (TIGR01720 family)
MDTDFFAFPASFTQQRLWFLDQLQPNSPTYNVSQIVTLPGRLNERAVTDALQEVVRRHETLRTTLPAIDGQPYQLISSQPHVPLRIIDLREWNAVRQGEEVGRLASEDAALAFDLAAGPLFRVTVLRGHGESFVLFTMHHAITDGSSMDLLAGELETLYDAYCQGKPSPLAELPVQYGDYAVWQRAWLSGEEAAEQLRYWKRKLDGAPQVLELPWDRPRPAVQSRDGATQTIALSRRLSADVVAFSRKEQVTPFMTLLGAFQTLMARLSGSRDIVIGTPIAGRARTELERLIGFFVNTLPLRTDLSGNPTLREIVHRAETTAMDAYARQDLPFDRIVAELAPDRTLSHSPLVQVLFALQNFGTSPLSPEADHDDVEGEEDGFDVPDPPGIGAKFDLTWTLAESEDGISGHIEYSTAVLDADTVRRWIALYKRILQAIVASPDTRLDDLSLLTRDERARAIHDWNCTDLEYPRHASLIDLFGEQVSTRPDAPAVVYGSRSLTYRDLDRRSLELAGRLIAAGVKSGDRVGMCLANSPDLIVSVLAIVRCGAAYVPCDPSFPEERVRAITEDASARLVLTPDTLGALPEAQASEGLPPVGPDAIAYVMYTSGSTGRPKGVAIQHRAIVRLVRNTNYVEIAAADRIAQASNAAFDATTFEIWGALLNGATLVGVDRDTVLSPHRYAQAIRRDRISILFVTTALFNQIAREAPDAFAGLKQVMFGGETADANAVRSVLAAGKPKCLMNVYGPTETTTFATFHEIASLNDDESVIPIGGPIGNTQVYVLDDRREPQAVGVSGELYIGGDGLALEYWRAPELTAQRFVEDPFRPNQRLYRTGDIARYRADGSVEFLGRRDLQVKIRGFRIELGEIESVLAAHESIREAVVAAHAANGSPAQLLGYVVWRNGRRPTVTELRAWVGARLPDYMVPAVWMELDALPLNANGKLDRLALPSPNGDRPDLDIAYAEPSTETEREIAAIWSQLLGIDAIGLHDNFFALGGHSLLATQAVARVRDRLDVDMPVRVMFERPTVSALAEWTDLQEPDTVASVHRTIGRRHAAGPAPLSFSQQRLWFLDQLDPASILYNIQTVELIEDELDVAALEKAVSEVIRRHEALRTRFAVSDGVAVQIVDPHRAAPLEVIDLSHLPARAAEKEYARRAEADAHTPFDLAAGPLFRAHVISVTSGDHRLVMTMHHVISDGWSLGVLHRELNELYSAYSAGREPALAALPIQYADFAVWQRQRLQGEELAQLLGWWRTHLQGAPHVINLPTDRVRPAEQTHRGETQTKRLAPKLRPALEELGQREGATLFITLLTAWFVLLHRFSGEDDLVIGTPIANRTRSELEPLIGFFVNTLLIRAPIAGNPTFRELLRQVRDAANGAYAHQDMPFERLVAELAPERRLSHTPLFQCFFALQNEAAGLRVLHLPTDDIESSSSTSMFDLSLTMLDSAQEIAASFEYSTELFDPATITRLMGHLERLLEGIAADADRPIFGYDLMSAQERRQVLVDFNDTEAAYPACDTVVDLLEACVARTPGAVALVSEQGRLTYAELDAAANRLAQHLCRSNVPRGSLVGLALERSPDLIVALFAILKAGSAYVPLDPQYPHSRLAQMISDARLSAIVTREDVAAVLPRSAVPCICIDRDAAAIASQQSGERPERANGGDTAYVIYTSGSTGEPKGVPIRHRSLLNFTEAASEEYEISARDSMLQFGSINFDTSVEEIFPVLTRGGTLVLRTPMMAASIAELLTRCDEWGVTVISLPTAFWHELVVRLPADRLELPPSLRLVIVGGDRALPERVTEWLSYVDGRVQLVNGYGPTEATVVATVHRLTEAGSAGEVPIGRPIRNTRVYVLDAYRQPVPIGVRGELWIAGDGLSKGYLHRPDLTSEKFVDDPFSRAGERMYRSGDVARWLPGGILEFRGRSDRQVKVRGFRIELGEIESALHQHEAVKESVVLSHEDAQGHKRLVAYVVPDRPCREDQNAAEPRQVHAWEAVFDDLYAEVDSRERPAFYIKGWESSYTGEPIPPAEVQAWMDQTVERILSLGPRRVREIGCGGSGLMLFRVAPHCESYTATDLSANAIRVLQQQLDALPAAVPGVRLLHQAAHQQQLEPHSVDAVLIVSVAQYFPSIEYLLDVLERAVDGVEAGGFVFLGDIRHRGLLEAFHTSVELARAPASLSVDELKRRVRKQLAAEKQLVIDPAFFHALATHIPRISAVETRLQRGRTRNELTCFRYDLILHVDREPDRSAIEWRAWRDEQPTLDEIREQLQRAPGATHAWTGVVNARVQRDVAAARVIASPDSPASIADVLALVGSEEPGVDPEDLWALADELVCTADISWPGFSSDGSFDVVFRPKHHASPILSRTTELAPRPWSEYANDPVRKAGVRSLIPELRSHLADHLPGYMVPAHFMMLDSLPLTPTGKVDRKALPPPEHEVDAEDPDAKPRTTVEETLARIWAEVLDVSAVGINDNFFQLGGDSILSIQVIARANEAGLRLTPKQLFQHQTIAELASVAGSSTRPLADRANATGGVPLTPIQRWFFAAGLRRPQEFTQSAMFDLEAESDLSTAQIILDELQSAHDAFRLRYTREEDGWRQFHIETGARIPVVEVSLASFDADRESQKIDDVTRQLQEGLNLTTGPIARAALFVGGEGEPPRLLLVAHHLVVDGVSWRILQQDVQVLLGQLRADRPLQLPVRTTSFQYWAKRLIDFAASADAGQALEFWTSHLAAAVPTLPLDFYEPDSADTFESSRLVNLSLTAEETRQLLYDVPKAYRTQINDVLLAALAQALSAWTGRSRVLIDVEGHGREPIFDEVDLSRTVGWFTSVYPIALDLGDARTPGEVLRTVKEQLRRVPTRGVSFGVLRYLSDKPDVVEQLRRLPHPQVCFNYLGQFGAVRLSSDYEAAAADAAPGPSVPSASTESSRGEWGSSSHLLDINGGVNDGRLWVTWAFSTKFHRSETVEAVARRFATELRRLIAHCTSPEARGYSPSDFPLAGLDQEKLDWLVGSDRQIADLYPLSPMQAGMLFHSLYDPDSGEYVEQSLSELAADLDVPAFRRAWDLLVERHTVLRTCFLWSGLDAALQMVRSRVELPWQVHDLSGLDPDSAEEALERYIEEDRTRGFDLSRAPLLRFALFRTPAGGWWFVWTSHHIQLDGWSQARLKAELQLFYDAARQAPGDGLNGGNLPQLEPVRPFRHYIEWLQQQDLTRAEVFWRETLRGFTTPTPLVVCDPADGGEDEDKEYLEQQIQLTAAESSAIDELVRQAAVTPNTAAQGAWALLLGRYNGEADVLFGATVAGRPPDLAGVERMVGLFINTLPVRIRIQPEISVALWLKHIQRQQIDAREFEHTPLVQIQGWSEVRRGSALFDSLLVFENYPDVPSLGAADGVAESEDDEDAQLEEPSVPMERTNFPLTVAVIPGARWSVRITYDAGRFTADAIARMLGHYRTILTAFPKQPSRALKDVPLLTAGERDQLLVAWNANDVTTQPLLAHQYFERQTAQTPDSVAVEFGPAEATYGELNCRANALAHRLLSLGAGPGALVGICVDRSIPMIVSVLAALKAGAGYVPLDPAYPTERLTFMIEDAAVRVLVTQRDLAERFPSFNRDVLLLDAICDEAWPTADPQLRVAPEDIAYVIYTSGSTGKPKGVAMPHGPLANLTAWHVAKGTPRPRPRTLQFAPLSFDVHFQEMFSTWAAGGTLVLVTEGLRRDIPALWRYLAGRDVDRIFVPFVALQSLAEVAAGEPLPPLREVITAGEQLHASPAIRSLFERLPQATLHNHYGPSETHVVTTYELSGDPASWPDLPPIGRPIDRARIYLLDDRMQPVPAGIPGQLYVGGSVLALGYLNRPDLTAARFIDDPFANEPGARLYATGDLARYLADGDIEFLGRADLQVKIRGFRIELGEPEAVLAQHPDVEQSVVSVWEDSPGERRLVAYVVPRRQPGPAGAELRAFLEARLPDYMVPATFMSLPSLPLTPSGKVDRKALPEPDRVRPAGGRPYRAPRDPVEERLAAIYADVLHVEGVGVDDNFFDLGGHSLLATRIVSRIRDAFQAELPLRSVFEFPTVAAIAAAVISAGSASLREQKIPRRREAGTCPLSYAQQRLWFLEQLQPNTSLYNVSRTFMFSGSARKDAVEAALNEIVRRHEALRTTYASIEGRPFQLIAATQQLALPVHDLRRCGAARRYQEYQRILAEVTDTPFDLSRGPVIRASFVRVSSDQCVLIVAVHHIATDGWSMDVFARELELLFEAATAGQHADLPALPIQYADYAVWQRQRLEGEKAALEIVQCRKRLADLPGPLDLPWDRQRPAVSSLQGATLSFAVPASLATGLAEFSRRYEVTPFTTLLAGFKALLARLSNSHDMVVGTPVSGRSHTEIEGLIGFFVNTLVLRTDLSGNPTLQELVRRVEQSTLEAFDSQGVPFDRLVSELAPERHLSHHPLVQVMFAVQEITGASDAAAATVTAVTAVEPGTAKFDLTLTIFQSEGGLSGAIEFSTDLVDARTVEQWAQLYVHTLEVLVSQPDALLDRYALQPPADRHRALAAWNDTTSVYPRDASLGELFAAQVSAAPDATAVCYAAVSLTYAELDRLSGRVAAFLRRQGVVPGARVAVLMERSPQWIAALLGIVRCGAAYVPLDPDYPAARRHQIATDAAVEVTITGDTFQDLGGEPDLDIAGSADAIAYVMYTSGSTGEPKGIAVPHRAVVRLVRNTNYVNVTPQDRVAQASHPAFDAATFEVWGPLLSGATIVGIDRDTALSPARYAHALREARVSILFITTALFNQIARAVPSAFATLRQVMFGGESADVNAVRAVLAAGKPDRFMNVYGPTETTTFATFHEIEALAEDATGVPIGSPIGNTQVYVLDARMEPQPPGVPGEICIGGDGLAVEYINSPELTAARFVANPFGTGRLYRTGDVGRYRDDGAIEFLRRTDDQVKVRGFRVETGEIEAVLRLHPAIMDAVVQPVGEEGGPRQLAAYVVPAGAHVSVGELREWLEQRVPPYMIPAHWTELGALPLTTSGKIDRRALPAPDVVRPDLATIYADPSTPLQVALATIWRDLLRIDRIGIHDSFFELGGHSLLAMQVISRLRDALRVEVPVRLLFERPTIAGLAQALGEARSEDAPTEQILPRSSFGSAPLSFSQQRLWFLDQIDPGTALFNIHDVVTFNGPLNVDALERAISEIVRRHEGLRTSFTSMDGVATQIVGPPVSFRLQPVDLTRVPRAGRESELARVSLGESREPFQLSRGPLFRARLVRMTAREHRLLLTLHHIVADGWSLAVLNRELQTLYGAYANGDPSPLADPPVQYADFAIWQRARLNSGVLQPQVDYWRRQLANLPRVTEIPHDRPRPVEESTAGARQTLHVAPALAAGIRQLCHRAQATPFMVLLAGLNVVLHRYTGESDLVVGCPVAGRTRAEIENLIGFFLNTLALRIDASGNPSFADLLARVRHTTLEAFANQDVPYERILEEIAADRLSRGQLFRIYFNVISFDTEGVEPLEGGDGESSLSSPLPAQSIFDLTLYVFEEKDSYRLEAVYRTELFDDVTIAGLLGHLQSILETAASDSTCRLSRFVLAPNRSQPLLPAALQSIRHREFPPEAVEQSIAQRFVTIAARHARRIAVKTPQQVWTYADLLGRARQVAAELGRRPFAPGDRVALLCAHDAPMLAGLFGVLMAGGVYVPLDPSFPRERHLQVLADCQAVCVITDEDNVASAVSFDLPVIDIQSSAGRDEDSPAPASDPDALAYILYTSGSSGQPKGVAQNHRNVLHHCRTYTNAIRLQARDRITLLAAYGFDAAVMDIFGALLNGATLYPIDVKAASPESLAEWLSDEAATVLHCTPTIYRYLLAHNPDRRFPAVRAVVLGGEEVIRRDLDLHRAHFPSKCIFVNGLGPTESTLALQNVMDRDAQLARNNVPVGRAVAGTEVLLLDDDGEPIAGCGRGELAFRSRHVALGYWRRPDLTASAFSVDASEPSLVTYRSGDIGHRLPDGRIEFVGRKDLQVKIRGVRIEPGEIEFRLLAHPEIQEAVVHAFEPAPDDRRLAAYIVARSAHPPSHADLTAFLRQRLPESMIPAAFVLLDSLPLTPNGKVDRKRLPMPDSADRLEPSFHFVAPSTHTARALAAIWMALLRVPEVSVTDNFFDLGGHSLLAMQLAARVRSVMHVDLPLRQYFASPVLGDLASVIDRTTHEHGATRIQTIPRVPRELYRVRVNHVGEFILPSTITAERVETDLQPGAAPFEAVGALQDVARSLSSAPA